MAEEAIRRLGWIFWIEKQARAASPAERLAIRQDQTRGHWDKLHEWLHTQRALVPDGSGIASAIDYSLNRWTPLGRFLEDGNLSCHNNQLENLMRPWAMGRKAWLFAGSELAGKRAATVMSLVQSARLCGHDPWAYLRDVLTRLVSPTAVSCFCCAFELGQSINSRPGQLAVRAFREPSRWLRGHQSTRSRF